MPISATIQASGESADEVRTQITDLVTRPLFLSANGSQPLVSEEPSKDEPSEVDLEDVARQKIRLASQRVGKRITILLHTAAGYGDDGYTTKQLAADMGVTPISLRSLAGNLGRTMAKINKQLGDEPPIYYWDRSKGKFVMPPEVRAAIREQM